MKKIIGSFLIIALSAMTCFYPKAGIVSEVNHTEDEVTVADSMGNTWVFHGAEDWESGDLAAMIMFSGFTSDTIYDDTIIEVRYCGVATYER